MAMTCAATVPVIAPRMKPTMMTELPRPPRIGPNSWPIESIMFSARPQRSMIVPMNVQNGIVSSNLLELDRPAHQAAGIARNLADGDGLVEERPGQIAEQEAGRDQEEQRSDHVEPELAAL